MKRRVATALPLFLSMAVSLSGHRLDEYLQATILSVKKDRVDGSMRLIPGVAVSSAVLAAIDTNGDGVISTAEGQAYATRVLHDLSLSVDGNRLMPRLRASEFPAIAELHEGLGEIHIEFNADLPPGSPHRRIVLENHHQAGISVYLMNCLIPQDPALRILSQNRNPNQSVYQLDYVQGVSPSRIPSGSSIGFGGIFRLGIRHIAEGTDHLLFLLALLLPAPLSFARKRWRGYIRPREALVRTLRVVTAFTVGHSLTLALAALGLVHVPSRAIELLIALSILVSAIHALRPLFPGREAFIAGSFGLIHGLAFAAILGELGLGKWQLLGGILAFNLGIEAMQLVVVLATMPSLVLLSHTRMYSAFRVSGALFAGLAAIGWICERLFGLRTSVDGIVNSAAHYSRSIAVALFLVSLVCWSLPRVSGKSSAKPLLQTD